MSHCRPSVSNRRPPCGLEVSPIALAFTRSRLDSNYVFYLRGFLAAVVMLGECEMMRTKQGRLPRNSFRACFWRIRWINAKLRQSKGKSRYFLKNTVHSMQLRYSRTKVKGKNLITATLPNQFSPSLRCRFCKGRQLKRKSWNNHAKCDSRPPPPPPPHFELKVIFVT